MPIRSMDQGFPADHLSGAARQQPRSQSLQNHSRRNHRQVWSSRVTRQDLQPSSHNPGVIMTCWYQSSVIYPIIWGGASLSSSQQPWLVPMRRWALVIRQSWRLYKGGANSVTSNWPLRLHAIQWRLKNNNLISSTSEQSTDNSHSRKYLPTVSTVRSRVGSRVCRMRRNRGSKWYPSWLRRYSGSQADRAEVWMIVVIWFPLRELSAPVPSVMLLQLPLSSDTSSAERGNNEGKNGNLVKNFPTRWGRLGRKTGRPLWTS